MYRYWYVGGGGLVNHTQRGRTIIVMSNGICKLYVAAIVVGEALRAYTVAEPFHIS